MSDNKYVVTLSNLRQNTLEFELEADGISINEADVQLVIEAANMGLTFDAKRTSGKKWEVNVPPLPMLKRTNYPFKVTLASEGFYFEPMSGSVNVVGNGTVNVTSIPTGRTKNITTMSESEKRLTAFGGDGNKLNPKEDKSTSSRTNIFENVSTVKRQPKNRPSTIKEIVEEAESQIESNDTNKKDELVSMILSEMKTSTGKKKQPILKKGKIVKH